MNLSFYTASVGARQHKNRMNVVANNITNVNTYGFKAEKPSFATLMYETVKGMDNEELPTGSGTNMVLADTDFSDGPVVVTNRKQDYAIMGDGFFALRDLATGELSFTRDGSFTLSEFQRPDPDNEENMVTLFGLSDGEGRFVLSRIGDILEVTDPNASQPVGVFDFPNVNGMQHAGGNRFLPMEKNGQVRVGTGEVKQGLLEASNTDLTNELTKIIESQRSYSFALKMVQTSDEIETTINQLRD